MQSPRRAYVVVKKRKSGYFPPPFTGLSDSATLFDAQALQNPFSAERGIGRYAIELIGALRRLEFEPEIEFLVNRGLPVGSTLEPLIAEADVRSADAVRPVDGVFHVPSPFEPTRLIDLWPKTLRHLSLVLTVHDVIPEVFSELYLRDPQVRQWYKRRLGFVQRADLVLVPSIATARDVERRLGVASNRIVLTGEAPPASFVPAADRASAFEKLLTALPRLEPGFLLYIGGMDLRKNVWGLLAAYARVRADLRRAHQLVVVCALTSGQRRRAQAQVEKLGIAEHVYFTGYVGDDELVRLCQTAHLVVFPSLYEGYGLPVAEAIACKTPVVAADTSAVKELIEDKRALFNPYDQRSIVYTIETVLTDDELRAELASRSLPPNHTWDFVATETKAAYDSLRPKPRRRESRRRRIAFVSPLPPAETGVADYSFHLLTELQKLVEVDAFVADPTQVSAPEGVTVRKLVAFDAIENLRSGYDDVVCAIGNSRDHIGALSLLRRREAVVLSHDVGLTDLYAVVADERPDLEPHRFGQIVARLYDDRYPSDLRRRRSLPPQTVARYGILMAREIVRQSRKFLVHSEFAARLARLDADSEDEAKIGVVPFGHPPPGEEPPPTERDELIATFGLGTRVKRIDVLIDAMGDVVKNVPRARLAVVGDIHPSADRQRYESQIERLGLSGNVQLTGRIDGLTYQEFLRRATVAVQLRAVTHGERSGAVADCLAGGVPTVVSGLGAARELPGSAVVKVPVCSTASELAIELVTLLRNQGRREALAAAGRAYARANSFAAAAQGLFHELAVKEQPPIRKA
jgi:glycosyltransferase involved in cell wall biosynthesis